MGSRLPRRVASSCASSAINAEARGVRLQARRLRSSVQALARIPWPDARLVERRGVQQLVDGIDLAVNHLLRQMRADLRPQIGVAGDQERRKLVLLGRRGWRGFAASGLPGALPDGCLGHVGAPL